MKSSATCVRSHAVLLFVMALCCVGCLDAPPALLAYMSFASPVLMGCLLVDDLGRQRYGGLAQRGRACSCAPSMWQAARKCAKAHVASICFRGMLQLFCIDVAK
jgi:hypothetical protein